MPRSSGHHPGPIHATGKRAQVMPDAIAHLRAPEVAARIAAGAAIILPMGSTETHGPAAPMGDFLLAEAIAMQAARAADAAGDDALVAPAIPFGGEDFFAGVAGGIALSPATLSALTLEALEALARGGAGRLLVINGHGGNIPAIEAAQRSMRARHGIIVPALHLWREAAGLLREWGAPPQATGHGGNPVLSVALHLFPQHCAPGQAAPRQAAGRIFGQPVTNFGAMRLAGVDFALPTHVEEVAPGGVQAEDPRGADADLGARLCTALAEAAAAMLALMRSRPEGLP